MVTTGMSSIMRKAILPVFIFFILLLSGCPPGDPVPQPTPEPWSREIKINAPDNAMNDRFGYSAGISGDYLIVGTPYDEDNGIHSGSAYIYVRYDAAWYFQQKLTASDGTEADLFGVSVSISGDYTIAGAENDDDNGPVSGSAYIYTWDGTTWTEQQKLLAADGSQGGMFGESVSISGDYAVIGASWDDDNGPISGSAYVYHRDGAVWAEQQKLLAIDGAQDDRFGEAISISGDYIMVGAFGDDDNGDLSGSAYIFVRDGDTWTEQQKLTPGDAAEGDRFGESVSIDGDYAVVGAVGDDDNGTLSGSVYIFVRNGTTWNQQQKLTAGDGASGDRFGESVSISGDHVIIGAYGDDDNGESSGSAYIFTRDGTTWTQQRKLTPGYGTEGDYCGYSVSISGNYAIAGAWGDDDHGDESGSVYVFY